MDEWAGDDEDLDAELEAQLAALGPISEDEIKAAQVELQNMPSAFVEEPASADSYCPRAAAGDFLVPNIFCLRACLPPPLRGSGGILGFGVSHIILRTSLLVVDVRKRGFRIL